MTGIIIFIFLFIAGVIVSMMIDKYLKLEIRCRLLEGHERELHLELSRKDQAIGIIRTEFGDEKAELIAEIENLTTQNGALKMVIEAEKQKQKKVEA